MSHVGGTVEAVRLLRSRGIRETQPRVVIASVFFALSVRVTVAELWDQVSTKSPWFGYVTVYRTLKTLVRNGLATEVRLRDGTSGYEPTDGSSCPIHLVCGRCGAKVKVDDARLQALREQIADRYGMSLRRYHHELLVQCRSEGPCRAARSRSANGLPVG